MTYQEFNHEVNSLDGNIARICVSDDIKEVESSFFWALKRLIRIYEYRHRILEAEK